MNLNATILNFIVGGAVTVAIVSLEENGNRLWSGFATLVPVFTLVSYIFIGASKDGRAVSAHSKLVLFGTIVSWIPYMIAVAILAPRIGTNRAVGAGLTIFFILAGIYLWIVDKYSLFR